MNKLCDKCGRNMTASNGNSYIGLEVEHVDNSLSETVWGEIYPDLPRDITYRLCYVCWYESMGIKIK